MKMTKITDLVATMEKVDTKKVEALLVNVFASVQGGWRSGFCGTLQVLERSSKAPRKSKTQRTIHQSIRNGHGSRYSIAQGRNGPFHDDDRKLHGTDYSLFNCWLWKNLFWKYAPSWVHIRLTTFEDGGLILLQALDWRKKRCRWCSEPMLQMVWKHVMVGVSSILDA